jgi:prephenate dehydrogenase
VIVTPSARSTADAVEKIEAMWLATGARVERMPPPVHDAVLARASHLPQVVASALACALADEQVEGRWAAAFGAGGLRDTTRIAASSAEMWRDICLTNRNAIGSALGLYRQWLERFADAVGSADESELLELFERGRRMRARIR